MYPFKEDLSFRQRNISKGTNTCEYIVLHHTAVIGSGNIPILLWERWRPVSCHFFIDQKGNSYKLGDPKWILWHCGSSAWEWRTNMNRYALGIEIEWPWFTKEQRAEVRKLTQYLMATFRIPKDRVIRHRDISLSGKIDPDNSLFWLSGFTLWRWSLSPKKYVK